MKKSSNSVKTGFSKLNINKSITFLFPIKEFDFKVPPPFEVHNFIYVADKYEPNEIDKARCLLLGKHIYIDTHPVTNESKLDLLNALYWCSYCAKPIIFDKFTNPLPKAIILPRSKP